MLKLLLIFCALVLSEPRKKKPIKIVPPPAASESPAEPIISNPPSAKPEEERPITDLEVEKYVGKLAAFKHEVELLNNDVSKAAIFTQRLQELEGEYSTLKSKIPTGLSASGLRGDLERLRIELTHQWILGKLNLVTRPPVVLAGTSFSSDHLRALLEGLLVDPEFCGSVKHCGKTAKGAPPLRSNLEYLFQAVESHRMPTSEKGHP